MKKILMLLIIAVLAVLVTAGVFLFPYSPDNPPVVNSTSSTQQGIQEVVNANNNFAFDLYNQYKDKEGNVFFSPYSISSALAMTYEGAKGQTAEEMKEVFYFPENNVLRLNFAAIYNEINKKSKAYELKTGNALWVQQDYPFLQDYLIIVEKYYGGKAANLDFKTKTEESRQIINDFIEEQTNDKIKDLIPQRALNSMTRLVLTNAIYFKGTWEWEFDKSDTRDRVFKITSDNIIQSPTMYMENDKAQFNYADTGDLQILELPYKGDDISMLILLPTENLDSLDLILENLNAWKSEMQETKLDAIYLPKFKFETKYMMADDLKEMGMPTAFTWPGADFSGMDGTTDLYISQVIHQAFIEVDEKGTEAAAATTVTMEVGSAGPSSRKIFNADHPFIFIIQQKETGNILFMGKVIDPTK